MFKCLLASLIFINLLSAESFLDMGPEKVRNMLNEKFLSIQGDKQKVMHITNITIENNNRKTPLRIYSPSPQNDLPIILYIHGGAWVAGSLDTHDNLARFLCNQVGALVVSVGYLNPPEGKFPLPLEQCNDALYWIIKNAKEYHANPSRLAIVGDSAGGGMAAALCLLVRDQKGPHIDFQALINPVVNNTWNGTLQPQGDKFDDERWIATQYIKDPSDASNPYVSPTFAKDLSNLPPALIIVGEKDMFRQDAEDYAARLVKAGVPTNVFIQWGVGHLAGNGARVSPLAKEPLEVTAAVLRGAFRE